MRWTKEQETKLIELYPILGAAALVQVLGRTHAQITKKAFNMGIRMNDDAKKRVLSEHGKNQLGDQEKEKNYNWKGGISKDYYHYKLLQKQRYPEKYWARETTRRAVKAGKIIKTPCVVCGEINVFAHHEDYSKPFEVVWLCRKHHREKHGNRH